MKTIAIKNLRGLKDTGDVELCPITMLVGKNSSGKSTFLRVFPLFKQGICVNKQGPILWYANDVDFGSFKDAVRKGENQMEFTFCWDSMSIPAWYSLFDIDNIVNISCHMVIQGDDEESFIKELHIKIEEDQRIDIVFNKEAISVSINGMSPEENSFISSKGCGYGTILPIARLNYNVQTEHRLYMGLPNEFITNTLGKIPQLKNKRALLETGHRFILGSQATVLHHAMEILRIKKTTDLLQDINWKKYNNGILMFVLDDILSLLDSKLVEEFEDVYYIRPFRANPERYYRKQNLAVKLLDSDGHNMAMFVNNLYKSETVKKNFQEWTQENFGFMLNANSIEGHISLSIKDDDTSGWCNITDKGFGYSQILPVILVLWQILSNSKKKKGDVNHTIFVAIEQPELHLHPKMQAQLMDAIIAVSKLALSMKVDIKFIIETHSQTMINSLGLKIALKEYATANASILLFNEDNEGGHNPQRAEYDNDGVLKNWPIGFFNPQK